MNFKLLIGASALCLASLNQVNAVGLHQRPPHDSHLVGLEANSIIGKNKDVGLGEMWDWIQEEIPYVQGLVAEYKKTLKREELSRKIAAIRAKKAAGKLQLNAMDLPTDQEHLAQLGLSALKLA